MENLPQPEVPDNQVVELVLNGLKLSVQQNFMSKAQLVAKLKDWYPDVEIKDKDIYKQL